VLAEVPRAEEQTDGRGHARQEGNNHAMQKRVLATYCRQVIQPAKENPVMKQEKHDGKRLHSQESYL
jgi:hypothetical protein